MPAVSAQLLVPLPSHLPTLSAATNGHQLLALDTKNTLFFSNDDGRHWTTIPTQWRGRAVRVNLTRTVLLTAQSTAFAATSSLKSVARPITAPTNATGASLTGTTTDVSGAIINNASITITDPTTKATHTAKTDSQGHYLVDNLTPGTYQLEATSPGFQKLQLPIIIASTQQNQADLTLNIGQVSEAVTVEASSMALTTPTARKKNPVSAPSKPATTIPIFEITTENGDSWTSLDGKTWQKK